jgi:micrococcal nuclease
VIARQYASRDRPRAAGPLLFWVLFLLLASVPSAAAQVECSRAQLLRVHDGDTVSLRCAQRTMKLRLADVDAPELGQRHGRDARDALRRLLTGRQLEVHTRATDRYGRHLGDVLVDGHSVSMRLVEQGWAWCGQRAGAPCATRQRQARGTRTGLWQQAEPEPPWQWRKRHPRRN